MTIPNKIDRTASEVDGVHGAFGLSLDEGKESDGPSSNGERRHGDRRGTRIPVFRFTNERRDRNDRRGRASRVSERFPLHVKGELRHNGVNHSVTTADLSAAGTTLLDAPMLPPGALVRLRLEPDDDLAEYSLIVWGQVRSYCSERAMLGLQFVSLRPCDARRLSRFVEESRRKAPTVQGPRSDRLSLRSLQHEGSKGHDRSSQ